MTIKPDPYPSSEGSDFSLSLERIVPELVSSKFDRKNLELHQERYAFAARNLKPGRVLDIACGVGYGVGMLFNLAEKNITNITGVDVSTEAIAYARRYASDARINFICAEATGYEDPQGFDTIVSLETIEHLPDPAAFLTGLVKMLHPGGVLVCSVPTTPSVDLNPYHKHDFTAGSFRRLLQAHPLIEISHLEQVHPYHLRDAFTGDSRDRLQDIRQGLLGYYMKHPVSVFRRAAATLHHGFSNHYLTLAMQRI
jgi:SAM-dependent methyltransferase